MVWSGVVGTALGAIIGILGTLLNQRQAERAAERKDRTARLAEIREQWLRSIEEYLEITQEIERVASDGAARPSELLHRMWFLHNRLCLVVSSTLRSALDECSDVLNRAYWNGTPDGQPVWQYVQGPRLRFRDAAKKELDELSGSSPS